MSRPRKVIDYTIVEKLAMIHCTQEEIAQVIGVSTRTLQRDAEFCRIYKKGINNGKTSLRRYQFEAAKKGNVTMLIWLGKQQLGQKEPKDTLEDDSNNDNALPTFMETLKNAKDK